VWGAAPAETAERITLEETEMEKPHKKLIKKRMNVQTQATCNADVARAGTPDVERPVIRLTEATGKLGVTAAERTMGMLASRIFTPPRSSAHVHQLSPR
jgi:hypothetical protein